MKLGKSQINSLCTGVKLAAELESSNSKLRKFLTVWGYRYDTEGRVIRLEKFLNTISPNETYFELRCYEISWDYYYNHWDVTEDELISEFYKDDIKGIEALEIELINFIQDFSVLKPEWNCDNLL